MPRPTRAARLDPANARPLSLASPIDAALQVNAPEAAGLRKLGLRTLRDLLYHFPARYGDTATVREIGTLAAGEVATVYGQVRKLETSRTFRGHIPRATGVLEDATGKLALTWFSQPYIAKMIPEGSLVRVTGKVAERGGRRSMANPEIERVEAMPAAVGDSLFGSGEETEAALLPVYPESRGVSSRWLYHAAQKALAALPEAAFADPIPDTFLGRYSLPALRTALFWIHAPKKASQAVAARKRFAFEEVFLIQADRARQRAALVGEPAHQIAVPAAELRDFFARFPFAPTGAQRRAIDQVAADLGRAYPMSRLVEGDVGSGKTFVAAAAAFATISARPADRPSARLQVAIMAPTEILARQHFDSFVEYFRHLGVSVALVTGSGCLKFPSKVSPDQATPVSRAQALKWVESGELPIVVGTHALIQKSVKFRHLGLVIIDEQHRFGMRQRRALARKDARLPHLLSMTATPIPRTLALTFYGDLDLSVVDELPPGRKPVLTKVVRASGRKAAHEEMRAELAAGRQAFVICPRIDEPDPAKEMAVMAASAKAEAARLQAEIFPEFSVGLLHGKMLPKEKDEAMAAFARGETDVLVATSVVEVGVNVPNATAILIEGAERFGLAQLHQLRGRVARSSRQARCYLATDSRGEKTLQRLSAMERAVDGFKLAELDLEMRGAGELSGGRQWGMSDLAMEALKNLPMVEAAREAAKSIVAADPELARHPALAEALAAREAIHFE
jgi:ATP-dependent DNA helicase RecG